MRSRSVINDSQAAVRAAFTLVEVLVVLVLISILSGMVMTAVRGVNTTARQARTRSIIAIVDTVIQEQYESYKYRPLPVEIPTVYATPGDENVLKYEVLASEAARVRLNMVRDLQRMELPDRISDIKVGTETNLPASIVAVANRVLIVPGAVPPQQVYQRSNQRNQFPVNWFGATSLPSRFAAYRRLAKPGWTPQFESAECLYLILATSFVGGAPALEQIPASNIGDLDNDGMPEILDGWGQPLGFVRWPVGYEDPELSIDPFMPDDFDPLRVDFASSPGVNVQKPWSIRPLIISAGSDREFGIEFHASHAGFRYNTASPSSLEMMTWPVSAEMLGSELPGRTGPLVFIDPFLRQFLAVIRPASPILGAEGFRDDNITNYQLAVSE